MTDEATSPSRSPRAGRVPLWAFLPVGLCVGLTLSLLTTPGGWLSAAAVVVGVGLAAIRPWSWRRRHWDRRARIVAAGNPLRDAMNPVRMGGV